MVLVMKTDRRHTCNTPVESCFGSLEQMFAFYGAMPTGVTVSENGRIFVCFPQWGDHPPYAVAEIRNGRLLPYPNFADNQPDLFVPDKGFISVQSVVADWNGNL